MKRFRLWAALALVLGAFAPHLLGQAVPTATRGGALQAGVGFTFTQPDYGPHYSKGISVYGDLDVTRHLGAEVMIHQANLWTPTDLGLNSYMLGPRYVFHYKRFDPYVKAMFGFGVFQTQYDFKPHTSDAYFAYAGGAGLEYHATPRINVRLFDYEYQKWPNFPVNGLAPVSYTFGVAYVFGR